VGAPQSLAANSGTLSPLGLTRSGALYYMAGTGRTRIFTASLNLNTGKTISPPRSLHSDSPRCTFPAWSRTGEQLSFVASNGTNEMALVLFTPADGTFHTFPLALQRPLWRTSHTLVGIGGNGHYQVDTKTGEARLLIDSKTSGTRFEGAWSPDGDRWYNKFSQWERGLFRYDFRTKSRQVLFVPAPGMDLNQEVLALSPDGVTLAFQVRNPSLKTATLMLLPANGGEPRPLLTVHEPESFQFGAFAWLPDSKRLLVARSRGQISELWLVPADGKPPRKIAFPAIPVRSLRMSPDGKTIAFHIPRGKSELRVLENFLR
jgi:Tol biopolymer transport system component